MVTWRGACAGTVAAAALAGTAGVVLGGTDRTAASAGHAASAGQAASTGRAASAAAARPLSGKVIVIDPGHNGLNHRYPKKINRKVKAGPFTKACDTTGTSTASGYTEHAYTFDVATRLAALLRAQGATVKLTRPNDRGVGPCVDGRAAIGNRARADAAISIHADGAPASKRGFHMILPGYVRGYTGPIVALSKRLGYDVRDAFRRGTGQPYANYVAKNGIDVRKDLGGLNMSKVPKVFIECGNMRNRADAARLKSATWRQGAAKALASGLAAYLRR
ncbi:N-acetylmuramoyl-L-alanine amidase [Actinomadura rubrisoli]|uniref:N-acetylmuramoyl-L-alanine amidase n=1 Tax=Actinomadura rubrisoli TaxID=2530368 RepID=A0A4R4ZP11_9ACTN|nr:N-acetylmuramoyl-L-alanine amidase [Actinomadura rubrisoli]TDD60623.1 N-acetylmuramoyl-L-alanine amidase [Actinomadura rubrisoli]